MLGLWSSHGHVRQDVHSQSSWSRSSSGDFTNFFICNILISRIFFNCNNILTSRIRYTFPQKICWLVVLLVDLDVMEVSMQIKYKSNIFLQNNNNIHKNDYNKNLFLKDFLGQPGHIGTKKAWSLVVFMVQTMAANPTTSNLVNIMLMEPVDLVKREAEPQNAIMSVKIRHIPKNTKKI